ncbi:AraC family transcriptional regulator ligand-binding domain-containing protein [Photobacterium sp. GB-56]|uniref:AraC family transcriptional regulator ligand-binding domain-containing protein n=2 Tax=unclassified Photobacterium TaxID=2628852 RepID=UPI000D17FAB4|nr:AraC family transcriptional regulator ligand-binding domain-containing protein [Photobacterium sp. GB-56]PSV25179.1 hypothetical protein C9J42_16685 [Photobacterium sp. GB-56]
MKGHFAVTAPWLECHDKTIPARQHIALLLDLLSSRGVNMHYVLRHTGIFYDDLITQDLQVSPVQFSRLISNVAKLEQFPELSFLFGQQLIPSVFPTTSHILIHAPTVNTLMNNIALYSESYFPLSKLTTQFDDSGVYVFVEDPYGIEASLSSRDRIAYFRWLTEYVFTSVISLVNWRADTQLPWSVMVDWLCPPWQEHYQMYWEKVNFNQPMIALHLPKQYLDVTLKDSSSTLYKVARKITPIPSCGLLSHIRNVFRQNLVQVPSLNALSEMMLMSPATLKRRLKAHHHTYRSLLGEVNQQHALYLQQIKQWDDHQIAQEMQFFDVSNYRRAIRRWKTN